MNNKKHYRKSYDTYTQILFEKIEHGGSFKNEIWKLRRASTQLMRRAKIAQEIDQAIRLQKVMNTLSSVETVSESHTVFEEMMRRYDMIHDDFYLVASFENFAKAELLAKHYVVHRIDKPRKLQRLQSTSPIHIRTLNSSRFKSEYFLGHFSLGMSTLLKPNYLKLYGLSDYAELAIRTCNSMRNSIHFGGPNIVVWDERFLSGIRDLKQVIISKNQRSYKNGDFQTIF